MRSTFKVLFYLKRNKDKDQKVVPVWADKRKVQRE